MLQLTQVYIVSHSPAINPHMKIIVILLSVFVIWWILRSLFAGAVKPSANTKPKPVNKNFVACHHCGLHVPEDEAILIGKHHYCCRQHAESDQRDA